MKVLWTKSALASLYDIYRYYNANVSITIACKVRDNILAITRQLEKHSHIGQIEELLKEMEGGHRYIVKDNYKIIYKIQTNTIYITDVFDTRQNPDKIKERNK
ncbi:MAG TPA: type II toxin-antitoxin system RelE/ParE family toxin [Prolixibacteraceae bacterium]|nr:type II toxin-antitoxin system RelE/ParE family toxin [Prolixibacteraceae bacterium]